MKLENLTGRVFTKLTVISRDTTSRETSKKEPHWKAICSCGKTVSVMGRLLKSGKTKSCGCLKKDVTKLIKTTHGKSNEPIYNVLAAMLARCRNSKDMYYGARGIKVCSRWESFENFYADMGEKPKGLTIDRIDTNGDYCKENCRWASRTEQARNTRRVRQILFEGEVRCLSEIAEMTNTNYNMLKARLSRGMTIDEALRNK